MACLAGFNLRPDQLQWTWQSQLHYILSGKSRLCNAASLHFCTRFALIPLLNDHDLLPPGTSTVSVLADLREAATSANPVIKPLIDARVSSIETLKSLLSQAESTSHSPLKPYHEYVTSVFKVPSSAMGSFGDLRYLLHTRNTTPNFKGTHSFQKALQSAIAFHRRRYQHQREWKTGQTMSEQQIMFTNRPRSTFQPLHSSTVTRAPRTSGFRFLNLPAELCNAIYELSIDQDQSQTDTSLPMRQDQCEINIFQRFPRITQVSKQLRNESLGIYLGNKTFVARQIPDNIDYLVHRLTAVGEANLKSLKLLSIEVELRKDQEMATTSFHEEAFEESENFREHHEWHELIACLSAFGLEPSQLRWTWPGGSVLAQNIARHWKCGDEYHFLVKYTLEQLLVDHDLLEPGASAISVLADLAEATESSPSSKVKRLAGEALTRVLQLEQAHALCPEYYRLLHKTYLDYLDKIFNEGNGVFGRFYNLKHLHTKRGRAGFKGTEEFPNALQTAVDLHRERHRYKRFKQGLETSQSYLGRAFQNQSDLLVGRSYSSQSISFATRHGERSNQQSGDPSFGPINMMRSTGTASASFGTVGFKTLPIVTKPLDMLGDHAPFTSTITENSSPFAALTRSVEEGAQSQYDLAPGRD